MGQSIESISTRIADLEKDLFIQSSLIPSEDRLHFMNGTKVEREEQETAIINSLKMKYPDVVLDESPLIFIHYVAAKDGKPADPADTLNISQDA
jgi:hypothetical protein